ncbi:hypothetical protein [Tateyamaria sp.]
MVKIKMRVIFCKFVRRPPDIATVTELLSHRGIDLKRPRVSYLQGALAACAYRGFLANASFNPRSFAIRFSKGRYTAKIGEGYLALETIEHRSRKAANLFFYDQGT